MAVKKSNNYYSGVIYVILSIFIILVILFILYRLYKHLHSEQGFKVPQEKSVPKNQEEALLQLNSLRKRKDFAWPLPEGTFSKLQLTEHTAFSLAYSEEHEQPAWVAYLISRQHSLNAHERRNKFRVDPAITTSSASPSDYSNSGYDRGHLAPAADFDYNKKALTETFFMSNISPQKPELNRGKWKELEELVRSWATEHDSLWVVTGPVLEKGLKKIGTNKVSVPKYFYKIILDPKQPEVKMIGFLMPNSKNNKELSFYAVPVDSIEKICRLDFFPQLPDLLEDSLESYVHYKAWFTTERK